MRRTILVLALCVLLLAPSCQWSGLVTQASTQNTMDNPLCWDRDTYHMGDTCFVWKDDEGTYGLALVFETVGGQPAAGLFLLSSSIREDINGQYLDDATTTYRHRNMTAIVTKNEDAYTVEVELPMIRYNAFDVETCLADGREAMYVGDFLGEDSKAPSITRESPGMSMTISVAGRMHRVHDHPEVVFAVTTTEIALYEYQPDETYGITHPLLKTAETHVFNYPLTAEKALVVSATNCGGGFYSYKHWFAKPQLPGTGNS